MGAISRWLDRFCYKHPRLGIPGLMKYIVIANVAVYLMDMFSNGYFSAMLRFYPALIMGRCGGCSPLSSSPPAAVSSCGLP